VFYGGRDGAKSWSFAKALRKFEQIVIHERYKHTKKEFELYSWKKDTKTGLILPIIVDAHNHYIDGIRYSIASYI